MLDGLDLTVHKGRVLGLVGESGSGKSVTALSVMRLIRPPGRIVGGEVVLDGRDLLTLPEREMRRVRGNEIAMVFQDPRGFLDPVARVGAVVREVYRAHERLRGRAARARMLELFRDVGLPGPERVARSYPHELSGGMAQRVMIALALACSPRLLIADEPTTALDVTVQLEIIRLLGKLRGELGLTVILITHDLGVIAEICDEVAVMYAGQIVELASAEDIFEHPRHPYTVSLLRARPTLAGAGEVTPIPGGAPDLYAPPPGCRFAPRCFMAEPRCHDEEPQLRALTGAHWSRCHFAERLAQQERAA